MSLSDIDLRALVDDLAATQTEPDAHNEYAGDAPNAVIRRANLLLYLRVMARRHPHVLLVMEAPGYRGCRLTGVPVTSRKILLNGVPELGLFGRAQGFQDVRDAGFERIYGEQSATIVWDTLADIGHAPLIWNTFPFHPHKPDQPLTNRRPRQPEMQLGATFVQRIVDLYQPQRIIAVGNVAHETLSKHGLANDKVRHPAQGGKNDFVAGLTALLG